MRFGLDIAQQRLEWSEIVDRARLAEELGFDGVWGFDHFKPMYGEGPGNCFEGMSTLAALATATSRVRLGLLVTGVTYRHPSVLAAEAVTIDHASKGRLELSLGAAWFAEEHEQLGIPLPPLRERIDRLEDALEVIRRLFTGEEVSYTGRTLSLDHARLLPRPVQQPHPPVWIGASGEQRTPGIALVVPRPCGVNGRWWPGRRRRPDAIQGRSSGPARSQSAETSMRCDASSTRRSRKERDIWCVAGRPRAVLASRSSLSG